MIKPKPVKRRLPLTPLQKAIKLAQSPPERIARTLVAMGLPEPVREHLFHPTKRWRFDLAWPEHKLAVEYDGGTFSRGRKSGHTSITGMARDKEKDAEAAIIGWSVIRMDAKTMHRTGPDWVTQWFEARGIHHGN